MVPLDNPQLKRIVGFLGKCDSKSTVTKLAGLLTAPEPQANAIRPPLGSTRRSRGRLLYEPFQKSV